MFLHRKKRLLGLDIGASYLKLAKLSDVREGIELSLFDFLPLPHGVIEEGNITDKERLSASLRELVKKAGVKGEGTVVGISGHSSVIIKRITIPVMTEEELAVSIRYEAEQHIPFDINDVSIDFQIIGPRAEGGGQMDVALVAAKKAFMGDYVEVVQKAGLNPVIVDADPLALANVYEANYETPETGRIGLVHAGASTTVITILNKGLLEFARFCPIGSNHHTEAIERFFNIPIDEAEKLKMGGGLQGVSPEDAQTVINSASDDIFAEIYRSFEYYKSNVSEEGVSRIILSGGAALIKGFSDAMAERLSIPVEAADPFRKIRISSRLDTASVRAVAPMAAVAVGLALRQEGDRG